jgi:hypothetical protein
MIKGEQITLAQLTAELNAKGANNAAFFFEGTNSLQKGDVLKFDILDAAIEAAQGIEAVPAMISMSKIAFGTNQHYYALRATLNNGQPIEIAMGNFTKRTVTGQSINPKFDIGHTKLNDMLINQSIVVNKETFPIARWERNEGEKPMQAKNNNGEFLSDLKTCNVFAIL